MKEKIFNKFLKESKKVSELFKKMGEIASNGSNEDFSEIRDQLNYHRGRMDALSELYNSLD